MNDAVFITGNQHKAEYLAKWLGMPLEHRKVEQDEIQSLDLKEVVSHKARQAGTIAEHPRGDGGFGWNAVFIPEGSNQTYGEMDENTFKEWNIRAHAIEKLRAHLTNS